MTDPVVTRSSGGSCALQGCLFGSVGLFVVMLLVMLFLGYRRFRENTTVEPADTIGMVVFTAPVVFR